MTIRKTIMGPADTVLMKGRRMGTVQVELSPRDTAAYLVGTRTTQERSTSSET
jgi:hypothetical protein